MSIRNPSSLVTIAILGCGLISIVYADPLPPLPGAHSAPSGYLLVDEEMWSELMDEAGRHLDRAREAFLQGHTRSAAQELRKAAIMMKIDAGHHQDPVDKAMLKSAHELDSLVERLRSGQSTDTIDEVDALSSRALTVLAQHEQAKAVMAWGQRSPHRSGRYLRAAADNLERATFRARAQLSTATSNVIRNARNLSSKLIDGTASTVDEAGRGIEALGHQIERFERAIVHPHSVKP